MTIPWQQTVHHDGSARYVSDLTPAFGATVRVRLRVGDSAPVQRVYVRTAPDGEQQFAPMSRAEHAPPVQWWEADLPVRNPRVPYRFLLVADDGAWWYTAAGLVRHDPLDAFDFQVLADYHLPDWLTGTVFYQIYPDRFANGDPANDPQPDEYEHRGMRPRTLPWGAPRPDDLPTTVTFYGGDLPGIAERLDHLVRLGVNGIYLNPIFHAYSVHRYDPIDYYAVDPHLGGDAALIALRAALDARDMRLLLDIVPNHCGAAHPWFRAAQADPAAPEADFFYFQRHPDDYTGWMGHKSLVKLNYESAELCRRMYDAPDSIMQHWLRPPFRADGWRVDVANMLGRHGRTQLGDTITRAMAAAARRANPDAYLIGENFHDGSAMLQGDQWNGIMNYMGFTQPLWNWLRGYEQGALGLGHTITAPGAYPTAALVGTWQQRRAAIPWVIALQQYNLLNSHDTPRIRSIVGTDDARHRLAVVLQMTLPGVPGIYYGDEVGMVNHDDVPHTRALGCMVWDEDRWDRDLFAFYQQVIALRRASPVLQRGGLQVLAAEADTLVYLRDGWHPDSTQSDRPQWIIVSAYRGPLAQPDAPVTRSARSLPVAHGGIPDGVPFREVFSGAQATAQGGALPLPAQPPGAAIWVSE